VSNKVEFDAEALGLDSHYAPHQHEKIRRLILEDWKKAGVKLPTYMKLLARYIENTGVPEEWLAKLSYQTMNRMLNRVTVRHEFWTCLHLYLIKKYGDIGISKQAYTDMDILGKTLSKVFAKSEATDNGEVTYQLGDNQGVSITSEGDKSYHKINMIYRYKSDEPFADEVISSYQGAAVERSQDLIGMVWALDTREPQSFEVTPETLTPLSDDKLRNSLKRLRGDICLMKLINISMALPRKLLSDRKTRPRTTRKHSSIS